MFFFAIKALSTGQDVNYLACPHCHVAHLDTHSPLDERTCANYGKSWKDSKHVWVNPLGVFAVQLKGKQLIVSGDAQFPVLASLTVEPSFLAQVFAGQSDPDDKEMARLCACGHSSDATFAFRQAGGFSLLYHMVQDGSLELVIPGSRGLRELLMNDLYCTAVSAHLGARKTIWALYQRVWQLRLAQNVAGFVRSYDICQHIKGHTTAPSGLLALLPIPASKFEQWTMDFTGLLPLCRQFNGIYVIVDKFSKLTHLVPSFFEGDGGPTAPEIAT